MITIKANKKGLKKFGAIIIVALGTLVVYVGAIIILTLGALAGYFTAPLLIEILNIDNPKDPEWFLPVARFFFIAVGGLWGVVGSILLFEIFRKIGKSDGRRYWICVESKQADD